MLCVTTQYDEGFRLVGDLGRASCEAYARRHRFAFAVGDASLGKERPPSWRKVLHVRSLFDQGHDTVLWVDADAGFVRLDEDIRNELRPDKDLFLVKHMIDGREIPNFGVFVLRNTPWSRRLLDALWEQEQFLHHVWWENAALLELFGYHHLLDPARPPKLDRAWLSRVGWLDLAWNSLPRVSRSIDPIISHYAGEPLRKRVFELYDEIAPVLREARVPSPDTVHVLGAPSAAPFIAEGQWHDPEPFRWTAAQSAELTVAAREGQNAVELSLVSGCPGPFSVQVSLDGEGLGKVEFARPDAQTVRFSFRPGRSGPRQLQLTVPRLWQPSEAGSPDTRRLGISVGRVRLFTR